MESENAHALPMALAWRRPSLYDLYFSLSPMASALRSRELGAVLGSVDRVAHPADAVLEAGCGPGTYTLPLAQRCSRVVAVDASPAMVGRLRQRVRRAGVANIDVRWGRIPDELDAAELFDGVVAAGVLDYLEDLRGSLKSLRSALRPNGWCVVTVPLSGRLRAAALLEGVVLRRAFPRREDEVVNCVVDAGLEVRGMQVVGLGRSARTAVVRARRPAAS